MNDREIAIAMRDEEIRMAAGDREWVQSLGLPEQRAELLLALLPEERRKVNKNCDVVVYKFGEKFQGRVNIYDVMTCARENKALPLMSDEFNEAWRREYEKLGGGVEAAKDPSLDVKFEDIYAVTLPRGGRCVYVNHDAGKAAEQVNEVDIIKDSLEHADEMNLPESTKQLYKEILAERQIKEANHTCAEALNIPDNAKRMCETLRNEIQLNHAKNCDLVIRKWGKEFQVRVGIEYFLARVAGGQSLNTLINDSQFNLATARAVAGLGGWEHIDDPSMKVTLGDVYAVTMPRGGRCVYVNDDAGKAAEETHSVPAAEPEERVADLDAFGQRFIETYNDLYNRRDAVVGYRDAVAAGDDMLKSRPEFVQDFGSYRIDPLTSDRDMAAFAFTMQSMGLIKGLDNYEKDFSRVRWSMGRNEIVERMHKTIEARNAAFQKANTEHKKKHRGRGM